MAKAKPVTQAEEVAEVALEAIEPIRHDGDDYAPGAAFTAAPEAAAALIASGAAKAAE